MTRHTPMTRRQYHQLATRQESRWLAVVLATPTDAMTSTHRAIVALVLRRRGVPSFQKKEV